MHIDRKEFNSLRHEVKIMIMIMVKNNIKIMLKQINNAVIKNLNSLDHESYTNEKKMQHYKKK
jgi:hypothetical protein